jgi:molybdopterin converting factor small subunit
VKVRIATPLFSYTGSRSVVEAVGATVEQVTRDLDRQFPGIRFRMIDEQGRIRPHMKVFLNGEQIFDLGTAVGSSDEIAIIQAFSGG